jgi:hypothetical protein
MVYKLLNIGLFSLKFDLNHKLKNSKELGCIFTLLERSYELGFNGI